MAKRTIDADTILKQARPLTHQHAHEIQPYGHLVKLPIALIGIPMANVQKSELKPTSRQ